MFLKVHKTPYLHRFFHYPPAILGIIILRHVLTFLVSLFTNGLLPLEIFKMLYLPYYWMDFDQIKRRINRSKAFLQWYEYKWYELKLTNEKSLKSDVLNECITDGVINNILQALILRNAVTMSVKCSISMVRLQFESQQDSLFFFSFSFLSNLLKSVLTLKICYLLKS